MSTRLAIGGITRRAPSALHLLALAMLVALASGCWTRASTDDMGPPAAIRVQNQSSYRMTMYAYRGAARARLGAVNPFSTAVLGIPRAVVGTGATLRFVGDPLAGNRQPISEEISVSPGDTIGMLIPP